MGRIFISYSRRDTETVDRIVHAMCEAGLDIWIDRQNIQTGNTWRVQIVQAIDTCDAFVLMLSPHSVASDNVRKEIDLAQDSGRTIFALMLEPVTLPAEIRYQLAGLQFINVQMLGLDKAVCQLIGTIKERLAQRKPVEESNLHQAELVIQGIDPQTFGAEKREQLLNFVSQLVNSGQSGLTIANMATTDSSHVFVNMPASSAYTLKTLALNRDVRLKNFGVTSLRLAGDSKFINITFGVLTTAATISFLHGLWLGTPSFLTPVVGITAGKVLTLSLAAMIVAGVAGSASKAIAPLLVPPSTPTQTLVAMRPSNTPLIPASGSAQTKSSEGASDRVNSMGADADGLMPVTVTEEATQTVTSSYPATQGMVFVSKSIACRTGPTDEYPIVSSIPAYTAVELIAPACIEGWWVVKNPTYGTPCWVDADDLDQVPGITENTPACVPVVPPPAPTPRPTREFSTPCSSAC